jgi:putative phage-type endonuclease
MRMNMSLTIEQLEERKTTIGASDLAKILGISPFGDIMSLYKEKVEGKQSYVTKAMQQGNAIEEQAREMFTQRTGIAVEACGTFLHSDRLWQSATPDFINQELRIGGEIKSNNEERHKLAKKGIVPDYYESQIQQGMEVMDYPYWYYVSCYCIDNEVLDMVIIKVERDREFMETATEISYDFWQCVMHKTPPVCKEIVETTDEEFRLEAEKNRHFNEQKKAFEKAEKESLAKLVKMAGGREMKGFGYELTEVTLPGRVDYSSIPELMSVDLEQYRKQPTKYWKIA